MSRVFRAINMAHPRLALKRTHRTERLRRDVCATAEGIPERAPSPNPQAESPLLQAPPVTARDGS
jgi:hypothetical protein